MTAGLFVASVLLAVSGLVGRATAARIEPAAPPIEPTGTNWEEWVAIATLVLAVATFCVVVATLWLAHRTGQLAKHAGDEAKAVREQAAAIPKQLDVLQEHADAAARGAAAAQSSAEAFTKPVLVDVTIGFGSYAPGTAEGMRALEMTPSVQDSDDMLTCRVPLRNAGAGLAIITTVALRVGTSPNWTGVASRAALPPGEEMVTRFSVGKRDPQGAGVIEQLLQTRNFSVEVGYTDAAGGQATLTRVDVYNVEGRGWRVTQVHLCNPETGEAYASSAPAF